MTLSLMQDLRTLTDFALWVREVMTRALGQMMSTLQRREMSIKCAFSTLPSHKVTSSVTLLGIAQQFLKVQKQTFLPSQSSLLVTKGHPPAKVKSEVTCGQVCEMEYVLGQRIRCRRERVYRPRQTYLSLSEEECIRKLRLTRQAVTDICHLLADELGTDAQCPYAFPVAVKVTAALHFYASGSFQHPLSSIGGISQSAISSAIHAVTSGLVRHAGEYIKFPVTPDNQERAKQAFCAKYGFPGVLGVIDCTHVQLRAPSENALVYINRKGTYSITYKSFEMLIVKSPMSLRIILARATTHSYWQTLPFLPSSRGIPRWMGGC
ncbi:putative nuclease HARBI1 [Anabarilius grahami]|uniref:Putative nuclease HARBI1 n=1 Tax=Anabarilius grahami TaxID=495550 RepID=A0A3N0YF21_ANAGA|nr:putative nuclease HARBI1 [Anabarilius grahami]